MKPISIEQAKKVDEFAIKLLGLPSICLMENAGRNVAWEVISILKQKCIKKAKVCVVCGVGNNAGDGFVAARHLINQGIKVDVFICGQSDKLANDPEINYGVLVKSSVSVKNILENKSEFELSLKSADVVIDAIFGVGLSRDIEGAYKNAIEIINRFSRYTISVDVPSGLNADSGDVYGVCVEADMTVTFNAAKRGFQKKSAQNFLGQIKIVDIGIPVSALKRML